MGEVRIAKKDVVTEVDEGFGVKVKRKVAIEGQPVPRMYADLVDDSDVDTEVEKTRGRADRRAAAEERGREERSHDEHLATVAAPADPKQKRRARAQNKARGTAKTKRADDDDE